MDFQRIRQARKAAGITQEELAHILGINCATLSKYESGVIEPSISQLVSIASALNTSLPELLGLEYGNGVMFSVKMSPELVQAPGFPEYANQIGTSDPDLMMRIVSEFSRQSPAKMRLDIAFGQLSSDGQEKVADYAEDILPRYRAADTPQSTLQPSEGKEYHPAHRCARNGPRGQIESPRR